MIARILIASAILAAVFPSIVLAQAAADSAESKPATESIWTRDKLTGVWGGLRSDLTKHDINIDLRLTQYYQGVTNGGRDTNSEYGGTLDYRVKLEGDKLFGTWEGF